MGVPKKKTSKAKRRSRRTHKSRVARPNLVLCANPECGAPVAPHRACPVCGMLKRRDGTLVQVIRIKEEKPEEEAGKKAEEEEGKKGKAEEEAPAEETKGKAKPKPRAKPKKKAKEEKEE